MRKKEYRFDVLSQNGEHYLVRETVGSPLEVKTIETFYTRGRAIDARDKERVKEEKRRKRNANNRAKNEAMRSLGLVRVKGALGGTYWE